MSFTVFWSGGYNFWDTVISRVPFWLLKKENHIRLETSFFRLAQMQHWFCLEQKQKWKLPLLGSQEQWRKDPKAINNRDTQGHQCKSLILFYYFYFFSIKKKEKKRVNHGFLHGDGTRVQWRVWQRIDLYLRIERHIYDT